MRGKSYYLLCIAAHVYGLLLLLPLVQWAAHVAFAFLPWDKFVLHVTLGTA